MTCRARLIPTLLLKGNSIVKTVNFKEGKYIGDPLNTVRIFNEKQVDEIMIIDINATVDSNEPNYKIISKLASECTMPMCYGGGITNIEQVIKIIELGVEKVSLSSYAIKNPSIIRKIADKIGSQSIAITLDVKKRRFSSKYEIYTHNGKRATNKELTSFLKIIEDSGAGEIIVNSINNDGMQSGYDRELIRQVCENISIPKTILGGGKSIEEASELNKEFKLSGFASGSQYVFKGKYRAVLINYPSFDEREENLLDL